LVAFSSAWQSERALSVGGALMALLAYESDKPPCPYVDCDGRLNFLSCFKTSMGYFDIDVNHHTEFFVCEKCSREVTRTWRWSTDG
jgi:hypothetical protein